MTPAPDDPDPSRSADHRADADSDRTAADEAASASEYDQLMGEFSDRIEQLESMVSELESEGSARAGDQPSPSGHTPAHSAPQAEADATAEVEAADQLLEEVEALRTQLRAEYEQPRGPDGRWIRDPSRERHRSSGDDFVYPVEDTRRESAGADRRGRRTERDGPDPDNLSELVEDLRRAISGSLREDAGEQQRIDNEPGVTEFGDPAGDKLAEEFSEVSIPDVVAVLTDVIDHVTAIADEVDDSKRVNAALWEILNDIQVELVDLERELSNYDQTVELEGDRLSMEEAIHRIHDYHEPFRRLAAQVEALQSRTVADVDQRRIDQLRSELEALKRLAADLPEPGTEPTQSEPDDQFDELREEIDDLREDLREARTSDQLDDLREEIDELRAAIEADRSSDQVDGLRQEIDGVREEVANVRDDLEAVKQWQESEFLENAEIEIREEDLREEFQALERENRAIKELLAGLQSRVD